MFIISNYKGEYIINIKIKSIEYYHPNTAFSNDYYINHFSKKGVDIQGLLNVTGREERYISTKEDENSLTMAIESCKRVLNSSKINKDEIGLVVFVSTTPEFLSPTNAIKIHHALGLSENCNAYDINGNCAGMIIALDQVCRTMKTNADIKYTLLIGSDILARNSRESEAITYANFGEAACAILLENSNDSSSDFIDSSSYVDSSLNHFINFPPKGFSEVLRNSKNVNKENKQIEWIDFNTDRGFASSVTSINNILEKNNLTKNDIKLYCLSQFAKRNIDLIKDSLNEKEDKFPFIGDKFGYTGVTSPFIALAESIKENKIKRGDNFILWTVGAGVVASTVLMKY